jgi:hypothetical protein
MNDHMNGQVPVGLTQTPGLDVQVTADQGRVRIDFNKPVAWFALPPTEAMTLAQNLLAHSCALTGLSLTLVVGDPQGQEQQPGMLS